MTTSVPPAGNPELGEIEVIEGGASKAKGAEVVTVVEVVVSVSSKLTRPAAWAGVVIVSVVELT
ncbi:MULTISPECIES: hypothetical protein [unclassified Bradyrhizobium]|uniref:hypothetical protein n=1 Tax=unclassified Bradyrhizobium TaxID=2631580 RepID=UPI002012AACC|nr:MULTISPECIES: hypothetical protein [unclassified Bradyrhizobium]